MPAEKIHWIRSLRGAGCEVNLPPVQPFSHNISTSWGDEQNVQPVKSHLRRCPALTPGLPPWYHSGVARSDGHDRLLDDIRRA
jgi:hypothetical protein